MSHNEIKNQCKKKKKAMINNSQTQSQLRKLLDQVYASQSQHQQHKARRVKKQSA